MLMRPRAGKQKAEVSQEMPRAESFRRKARTDKKRTSTPVWNWRAAFENATGSALRKRLQSKARAARRKMLIEELLGLRHCGYSGDYLRSNFNFQYS